MSSIDTSVNTKPAQNSNNKRRKKKSRKEKLAETEARSQRLAALYTKTEQTVPSNVQIEYVAAAEPTLDNPELAAFAEVFEHFNANAAKSFGAQADDEEEESSKETPAVAPEPDSIEEAIAGDETSESEMGEDAEDRKESRRQRKRMRMSVAELKQAASRPEVVEWTDVSARDPRLLVELKALRNTVPVPVHWSQKKKYLQYKRGMEKPPFELPDFIKATGIMEMRDAAKEKEDEKTASAKARERIQPKMHKLTLDYQRLHDAFFKFQTPPKNMTGHGDLFYEGKESDTSYNFTPGTLSDSLKQALNMPPLAPPPWLINMQRFGPPPSYPNLVIPGLNAPIPQGAQWGYHPGGWGRPPVDEFGRPLYGDVFAAATGESTASAPVQTGPKKHWGDLEIGSSDEEDSESEEEEEEASDAEDQNAEESEEMPKPESTSSALPSGLETPSVVQTRKSVPATASDASRDLYTVLSEQATQQMEGLMGSQYTYDLGEAFDPSKKAAKVGSGPAAKAMGRSVDVSLDAEELDSLDQQKLRAKYEAASSGAAGGSISTRREDLSDMVADHAKSQARKRKAAEDDGSASKRRNKEYKF
ncbi:hypothetical protein FBU59_002796 [Linderina macrospora]|uniref:Uncharacterized protein n=1 Tax=Linderina macrospora TaxID=4868 RepID=A0ACC1JAF8_9FUNG|nr:hypothetical protein FBU59_002796 [Linderina macrospora]